MRLPVVGNSSFQARPQSRVTGPIDLRDQKFGDAVKLDLRGTRQELEGSMAGGSVLAQSVSPRVPIDEITLPTDPTQVNPAGEVRKELDSKTAPKNSRNGTLLDIVA